MKKIIISTIAVSALLFTTSCENDFDTDVKDIVVTSGEANFKTYVALGNSLTSGYRDGALYLDGQNESYPSMIAAQMKLAGGGDFKQPLMPNNTGGFTGLPGFAGKLTLQLVNGSLTPVPSAAGAALDNVSSGRPYQNMGVPGAKSYHLVAPGYGSLAGLATGTANPYFVRFASSSTTSVLADAMAQSPTFFSLWIGNNDVLFYAVNGGTNSQTTGGVTTYTAATVQTGTGTSPALYKSNDISDPTVVAGSIKAVLDGLKSVGSTKGVIANIPYVTSIPYFTTVPYNPLTPAVLGSNITTLNTSLYGPLKQALTAFGAGDRINLLSSTSANPVLIKDNSLQDLSAQLTAALTPSLGLATATAFGQIYGQARQATAEDYLLLTTSSVIGTTAAGVPSPINIYGISYPLQNQHVLTKTEAGYVKTTIDAYNSSIRTLADTYGLAFVDSNAKMLELNGKSGITYDGVKYTAKFVSGGAFSLDGVHLTGRGYAFIANEFIKAINSKYKSTLPQVDPNKYSGVKFP
ncbi:lysophospholipase L1-like esterase [Chryseobacterium sp. SORGH_AS909]|nr:MULTISPECIES: G-D-S-L family lipolytic protein [unclassified Chryseobacterium]MDQ1102302.1 lysophospholipase L1-like esterase [Chryseobacterium sp. SORGH_AS_1048]MDR6085739.1 lysophospholipase L1-like esterase [Chryseobacterium sp. SORGH_AS_0909]MDR6130104.1 lysophospholipase L1-like esterase [Chryseobacterium sp. SORGH_AS_1175]MDT3407770.1 lysophospholipase L1-like esterase [Pseudacidovorax intermedius]